MIRDGSTMPALVALLLAGASCGSGSDGDGRCGPSSAVVTRVVDGDTVELEDGTKLRYLMVDTPETTGGKNECYGQQAMDYNIQLVQGKTVTIAYDEECEDRFDRLLAWVSVQGREVNRLLVERGYACVLFIKPNGAAREAEFDALEAQAKAEGRGMWGACAEVACD